MITWKDLPKSGYEPSDSDTIVRQSTIGQLQLCSGRVGYETHDGYLSALSEALVFGTCVHHIISSDLLSGMQQQDALLQSMGDWVEEILLTDYEWTLSKVPNVPEFFSEISVAYARWRNSVLPKLPDDLLAVEQEMYMPLGEGKSSNISLKGTADAVFESSLVDWKTAGRGWKADKAAVSMQASLYMPLVKQNLDTSVRKFTFWVYNRQAGRWDRHVTQRSVAQINSALVTAHQYGLQLEAEVYPCTPVPEASFNKKRGWYCSPKFCGAWNVCEAKVMNDDVDEKVIAERNWN